MARDFDLIEKHRERALVGLSLTGTPEQDAVLSVVEPNASPVPQRMQALQEAHEPGLRTLGMLCPLMPSVADAPAQIEELFRFLVACGVEALFAEAVNHRGPGLKCTEEALRQAAGFDRQAQLLAHVRKTTNWSRYVVTLNDTKK